MIFVADGKGDGKSGGLYRGDDGVITTIKTLEDTVSIGQYYSSVTHYLGYTMNRHEGKITGLAAYGNAENTHSKLSKNLFWNSSRRRLENRFMQNEVYVADPPTSPPN